MSIQPSNYEDQFKRLFSKIEEIKFNVKKLDDKFVDVLINQNTTDHKFSSHDSRITTLEKAVYGIAALILTTVIYALVYTVVKK